MGGALLLIPIHAIMAWGDKTERLHTIPNDQCPTRRQFIPTWHSMRVYVTNLPTYMEYLLFLPAVNKSQPPARSQCTWKHLENLQEKIKDSQHRYFNSGY